VRTNKEHTTRQVHYRHPPKVAIAIAEYLHLHLQPMSLEPIMALLKEPANELLAQVHGRALTIR
jgi:hypothetical protein